MQSRQRVIRALEGEQPDRAPRDLSYLPGVALERMDELDELTTRYPMDISRPPAPYQPSQRARGSVNRVGVYVDDWGCTWDVSEPGMIGEVKDPPLADWGALADWAPPYELLERARWDEVNAFHGQDDTFTLAPVEVRPFERMQFLRGTEALYQDLMLQSPEFLELRDQVHGYNLRSTEAWCKTDVDGWCFVDDWGSHASLLIAPHLWRELFKPLYKEYCDIARAHGKYIFMHSDGVIDAIIEDLIEIGVHALNAQVFLMDLDDLAKRFKGRITFWGEVDRQYLLPFGTPENIRKAVHLLRQTLDGGTGRLIAQCEWGNRDPMENIETVFAAWEEPLPE